MKLKKAEGMTKREWVSLICAIGIAVLVTLCIISGVRWWWNVSNSIDEGSRQRETIKKNADTYPEYVYEVKDYKVTKMTTDSSKSKVGKGFDIFTNDTQGLHAAEVSYIGENGRLYGMEQAVFVKYSVGIKSPELHVKRVNVKGRYKGVEINPTLYLPNKTQRTQGR
ncbi:hypothetical protein ACTFR8_22195 [Bacillus cereus group sp. MYBK15-3]|uniref:hypothetical protein n=1 Tax=Bacillus cereus group TaxID=86661 RepID=UPI001C8CDC63|nr:hypothetical protein [Bacillus cereus]MBX9158312.1 hypothetical protein [Bacillus cereus]